MAFSTYETSVEDGSPSELYHIFTPTENFYYTTDVVSHTFAGNVYNPVAGLSRSRIEVSADSVTSSIEVRLDATTSFPRKYINNVIGQKAEINIYKFHRNDGGTPERVLIWAGVVQTVSFSENARWATLACLPITSKLARSIPREKFQSLCNNVLYDSLCSIPEGNFTYTGNVSATNGREVTVDGLGSTHGDDWATGGYIQDPSGVDKRMIVNQTNDVCTLLFAFRDDLTILGQNFSVIAGCDHTTATCNDKFDNLINYRGFAFVPDRNVFRNGVE